MDPLFLVCETFDQVAATSSRLEKERLLRSLRDNPETNEIAREMVSAGLDWYRHYGVRSLPQPLSAERNESPGFVEFRDLLKELEGGRGHDRQQLANFLDFYPPTVSKWLRRVILKDLEMGVSWVTANKIWPGCVKTFEVQLSELCTNPNKLIRKLPLAFEPKIDGIRSIALVEEEKITFLSRSGNEIFMMDHIKAEIRKHVDPGWVLDGELFAGSYNDTMKVCRRTVNNPDKTLLAKTQYHIFDMLTREEWDTKLCVLSYPERRERMVFLPESGVIQRTPVSIITTATRMEALISTHLEMGYEGSMGKTLFGRYSFGRSADWVKVKPVLEDDFLVVGHYEGSGRNKGRLGGLVVQVSEGLTCNVGGGFNDQLRNEFWVSPPIGKIVQVEYKMRTPDGRLREPQFQRLREDKDAVD
jgi:DNA ligase 1